MTTIDNKDVQKIAGLAKLSIPEASLSDFTHELDNILTLVAKMDDIDTSMVKPLAHPVDTSQPLRDDTVTATDQRELFQQNAPATEAGLYIVPKFMETE